MIVGFVKAEPQGDRTLASAHSKQLSRDFGWRAPCGNLPAAYLTGLLAGLRAKASGIAEAILDAGVKKPTKGSRIYAALKGVVDAGIEVPHDPSVFPEEGRIRGEHIADYAKLLSQNPPQYERQFSQYLRAGLRPEDLPSHFEEVRAKLLGAFGAA